MKLLLLILPVLLSSCASLRERTSEEREAQGRTYVSYMNCMDKYAKENALSKTSPTDIATAAQSKCSGKSRMYYEAILADQQAQFSMVMDNGADESKAAQIHFRAVEQAKSQVYETVVEARK